MLFHTILASVPGRVVHALPRTLGNPAYPCGILARTKSPKRVDFSLCTCCLINGSHKRTLEYTLTYFTEFKGSWSNLHRYDRSVLGATQIAYAAVKHKLTSEQRYGKSGRLARRKKMRSASKKTSEHGRRPLETVKIPASRPAPTHSMLLNLA